YDHPRNMFGPGGDSWADARAGIIEGAAATDASVLVASTLPDLIDDAAAEQLTAHGVPFLAGVSTGLACAAALRRPPGDGDRLRAIAAAAGAAGGLGEGGPWLDEADAKSLLREADIPTPRARVAVDAGDAVAAWRELGGAVAMKLS